MVFRGTYSITNTIVDLSANLQPYLPYSGGDDNDECTNCTVHAGFMISWQNARPIIFPHLLEARKHHPDYKLVLVGHSLGGAVAALAALEMKAKGWQPQTTTFGEPRVGNAAFVEYLDCAFGLLDDHDDDLQFRRVTHVDDPIPLLPMEELGYKMHAGEMYISKPSLPPEITDVQLCDGDQDARCVAASEARSPMGNLQAAPMDFESDACGSFPFHSIVPPIRYRLQELLFAHRDYFYRLGFCVPGGDPSRFRSPSSGCVKSQADH